MTYTLQGDPAASFVVCAHNPRMDILRRVLCACAAQRTDKKYQMLLVDSGSSPPLLCASMGIEVEIMRLDEPGLALARARGIERVTADTIIFVDDDTILDDDYLEQALVILERHPFLGAVGGQLVPEFDGPLPLPEHYYRERLAIREFVGEHWSNRWDDFATTPIGGGMVVRRVLARTWVREFERNAWAKSLGRKGAAFSGGEDIHLVHTVCAAGFGKGVFEQLRLTHFMPANRLEPAFLERIAEGNARSGILLQALLAGRRRPPMTFRHRLRNLLELANCRNSLDRRLLRAELRGLARGCEEVARMSADLEQR
jgi:hypothetical protein